MPQTFSGSRRSISPTTIATSSITCLNLSDQKLREKMRRASTRKEGRADEVLTKNNFAFVSDRCGDRFVQCDLVRASAPGDTSAAAGSTLSNHSQAGRENT